MERTKHIVGEIRGKRMFSIRAKDATGVDAMRQALLKLDQSINSKAAARTSHTFPNANDELEDDDIDGEGPNHRGTYSKAYTVQHPEIKWVHRGQGRYLPLTAARAFTQPQSQP